MLSFSAQLTIKSGQHLLDVLCRELNTINDLPRPTRNVSSLSPEYNLPVADDDLFVDKDDRMEVDPNDLGPVFHQVLTLQLAKKLVDEGYGSWTKESALQEAMSSLLASCNGRGLNTIRVIVTRKNGKKAARDFEVDKISKIRKLQ